MTDLKKLTRAEQKARRPIQILDAAFEEFVERGYVATRVEDIASRVGVTKGTIYVYFETKEQLFEAMIRHISEPLENLLASSNELKGTVTERLQGNIELIYDLIIRDRKLRELMRFVIAEGSRFPQIVDRHHDIFIEPLERQMQSLIDEGVKLGEFRPAPAAFCDAVVAPAIAFLFFKLLFDDRQPLDKTTYLKAHIDLVMHGLLR
ncbi:MULTISPECIES: TetR/AcrR family transcriptional regulator [Rhizobium]|uniref:TetR/AcrR family transcriptional regulator n=1 Tax=Rhizobium tropici TaxID=398 RepID=A0A329YBS7_RHITR|nr:MULTISPECIES: TetR/AcrR family transcriptional regulator [Rhizobium]MBB3290227.1 AcrR family transcriptional regulator [Rhizobium sp. BK252]MBB3404886.1 AcrR family transcriptional regulator [Rhizobium sp. BK289]MBB3417432.1 AcrR family transcriptional regulator [Rhizobium sp. BK284]MBB3485142.1 AcrR family transcriptional regulator [Rhizobium sp. BK347]MDK4721019.1 TetR/AcrR family transcriptional regulator [Rhizobium sp. CNPSo 3968]